MRKKRYEGEVYFDDLCAERSFFGFLVEIFILIFVYIHIYIYSNHICIYLSV